MIWRQHHMNDDNNIWWQVTISYEWWQQHMMTSDNIIWMTTTTYDDNIIWWQHDMTTTYDWMMTTSYDNNIIWQQHHMTTTYDWMMTTSYDDRWQYHMNDDNIWQQHHFIVAKNGPWRCCQCNHIFTCYSGLKPVLNGLLPSIQKARSDVSSVLSCQKKMRKGCFYQRFSISMLS